MTDSRHRWLAGAALACILLGVVLLNYRPIPDSADGMAILSVAASMVRHGSADIEAFAASDAQFPMDAARMGARGLDGALVAKKGITPSLALLPLVALSEVVPGMSAQAAAMLLNPLVLTATALVVYGLVLHLRYRLRTAFATGLIFGLATLALPYAGTLFGEPLAGLLLSLAVAGLMAGRGRWLLLAGLSGGLLVGVNTVYVVTLGVLGLWAALLVVPRRNWRGLLAFTVAAAVPLLLIALYNTVRFGGPLETGYRFADGEGFTVNPLFGAYGMLLSPYKGLLWYSPALVLSVVGWPLLRRRAPALAWGTAALVVVQVALFAAWWSWHGGFAWGPRFLLPIVPLLTVWMAPIIERSWTSRPLKGLVSVFVVLGIAVSLAGALLNYLTYIAYLTFSVWGGDFAGASAGGYDALVGDLSLSPVIGHLALLWGGWPTAVSPSGAQWLGAFSLIALGTALAWLAYRRRGPARTLIAVAAAVSIAACVAVVVMQGQTPQARQIAALSDAMQPAGVVVAETAVFGDGLIDLKGSFRVFTANAPNTPDDPDVAPLWARATSFDGPFWLLNWFPSCDPANWMEAQLWETSAFFAERPVEGHRAVGFYRAADPVLQPESARFGDVSLSRAGTAIRDDGVQVALEWEASAAPAREARWFVHLLNPAGEIMAQQDRAPQGGCRPMTGWTAGETVVDRLFFPGQGAGDGWTLRIGWVDGETGALLPVTDTAGLPLETPYLLIPLATR